MDESQYEQKLREQYIARCKKIIHHESITDWLSQPFRNCKDKDKIKALNACTEALLTDVIKLQLDLCSFYKVFEQNKSLFSSNEAFVLNRKAESIIRDTISLQNYLSEEREHHLDNAYIEQQGFKLNTRYIFTFPENPKLEPQEWIVTEFRAYDNGNIRAIRGHKIKTNGEPYARAQYISLPHTEHVLTENNNYIFVWKNEI